MKTLFVDRKNSTIEVQGGRLTVKLEGRRSLCSIPCRMVEMLVISAPVQFSSTLLTRLTQEGITTVFINMRQVTSSTMTHGLLHNDARRRLLQYQAVSSEPAQLYYAQQLVLGRVSGQRTLLDKALRQRPDRRYSLTKSIAQLESARAGITRAYSLNTLRGVEGAAAAAFFSAYQTLFPAALGFTSRNRRPPRDPVNVVLSLSYTLLHAEAVRTLFAVGFDPLLGIYHQPDYGRESLACDLVELFRSIVEHWVWRLFAEETLRATHFSTPEDSPQRPCVLGKAGREIYYLQYSAMAEKCRRLMRRVARNWLTELTERYLPQGELTL